MCVHPFIHLLILISIIACSMHASDTPSSDESALIAIGDVNVIELIDKGVKVENLLPMEKRQLSDTFKRWLDDGQYVKIASYFPTLKGAAMECLCPLLTSVDHFNGFVQS